MNTQQQRTRLVLAIVAALLVTLFVIGSCVFDLGVAIQIGKINNCVYPPHTCTQP